MCFICAVFAMGIVDNGVMLWNWGSVPRGATLTQGALRDPGYGVERLRRIAIGGPTARSLDSPAQRAGACR